MPVPLVITDLSTSSANNYPTGSDTPSSIDDVLRAHGAFIAQLRDGAGFTAGAISGADIGTLPDGSVSTVKIVDANVTLAKLAAAVQQALVPAGTVLAFAASTAPSGYLECDGAAVSRATYSALFAVIGTTYGTGDGSTTFNLPDLRGEFVRGWDHGKGTDAARALGSAQSSANLSHTHTGTTASSGDHYHEVPVQEGDDSPPVQYFGGAQDINSTSTLLTSTAGAHTHTFTTASSGGLEARPRNIALMFVIKT